MLKKGTKKFSIINDGENRVQRIYKNNNKVYEYLPKGYIDCEYIEGTGTQYIDTGLIGKSGYTLETSLSFSQLATGNYQYFAGHAYTGSADRLYFIRMSNTTKALGYTYGSDNSQTSNFATLTEDTWYSFKSIMKANEQKLYLDGTLLGGTTFGALSYDAQNPKYIYMFVSQYVSGVNGYTKARCRYAKWYDENNTLVRHFVPCLDNNGVACMYDLVTKQTFYNQGTGDFKYKLAVLPLNYKQCNYIESTGTQYIDTGLKMNQDGGFEVKFLSNSGLNLSTYGAIFGARNKSGNREFHLTTYSGSGMQGTLRYGSLSQDASLAYQTVMKAKLINGKYSVNDGTETTLSSQTFTTPNNVLIFALNQYSGSPTGPTQYGKIELYYLKLYDGTTLKRYFIPCLDNNSTPCLYDAVTKTTFYNSGTGTFGYELI